MTIQPISTAFGDPQRHDFSLPDRGRCPRDAPKPAASAGTGVAPKDANQREREADVDLSAANGLRSHPPASLTPSRRSVSKPSRNVSDLEARATLLKLSCNYM